eukprot:525125_1
MMGTHAKIRSIFLAIVVVISHAAYSVGDKVTLKYDLEDVDGIDGIISIMGTDAIVIPKGWPLTVIEIGLSSNYDRIYRVEYLLSLDRPIMKTTIPEPWLEPVAERPVVIERNVSARVLARKKRKKKK